MTDQMLRERATKKERAIRYIEGSLKTRRTYADSLQAAIDLDVELGFSGDVTSDIQVIRQRAAYARLEEVLEVLRSA